MDVKRIVGFVLLGSALGIVFFVFYFVLNVSGDDDPGDLPFGWGGPSFTGIVASINESEMVVNVHDGGPQRFRMDEKTRTILWGNQPLNKGIEVKVIYKVIRDPKATSGQYLLAKTVRVLRSKATPSPSASPGQSGTPAASESETPGEQPSPSQSPAVKGSATPKPH